MLIEQSSEVITVTPTLDTIAYADGDVLFNPVEVTSALLRAAGMVLTLESLMGIDADDQGVAFDLVFLNANTNLGTINAAPSISDANALKIISPPISITPGNYIDLGGCRLFGLVGIRCKMKGASSTNQSIWMAGITRGGTPTYTASGLSFQLGFSY